MANYAILRVDKCKMGTVARINKHHERLKKEYKSNPDIDLEKSRHNYHLVEPHGTYKEMVLERIQSVGARMRKDSVVMQDALISASPDWIKDKTIEEQKEFFNYAFEFVKERYGEENIISAVVHMDEATPHMHFVFVPITSDGRLSSKDIIGGPKGMVKLQDDFYDHISARYPDISRGIPARVTHRTHLPTALYKNAHDLYEHYDEICTAIKNIGRIGSSKAKDRAIELLGRYAPEMAKMEDQLKTTDKRIESLEREISNKDSAINRYRAESREKSETIDEQADKIYELNRKQNELMKQISLIPPEVLEGMKRQELERRKEARRKEWSR